MLSPQYLARLPERLVELYAQVETDILVDMAERISAMDYYIPAAQWQHQKLQEMGLLSSEITQKLSAITGKTQTELRRIMTEAGAESLEADGAVHRTRGGAVRFSPAAQKTIAAGLTRTSGLFSNLSRTTAKTATKQFEDACDRAYLQITTGAFSRQEAIKIAVKDLSSKGVQSVSYGSGKTDNIEAAVRRAVVTGVNQSALQVSLAEGATMGCELMELTAHAGARPSHAEWQGKVVRVRGAPKPGEGYLTLSDIGYGTGAGFGGWNCRHSWGPYWEGDPLTYSDALLNEYNAKTTPYNGEMLTEYDASQVQRKIERNIRECKREFKAMEAAGVPTDEVSARLGRWQAKEKDFLAQTGFKKQGDRSQIPEFGRSKAARAAAQANLPEDVRRFNVLRSAKTEQERLPGFQYAEIPRGKLSGYALNKNHPTGRHKAVAFESVLGYTVDNEDKLIRQVRRGLSKYRATERQATQYGQPFEVQMMVKGPNGRYAKVKTGWIIEKGQDAPRLTTIYVDD